MESLLGLEFIHFLTCRIQVGRTIIEFAMAAILPLTTELLDEAAYQTLPIVMVAFWRIRFLNSLRV